MKPFALLLLTLSFVMGAIPPPVIQWQRGFGTAYDDQGAIVVKQTADGGYIVGASQGDEPDTGQYWLLRLDANGNTLWQRTGGRSDGETEDGLIDVEQTSDGGFIALMRTDSGPAPGDTNMTDGTFGGTDVWVVRFDASGNRVWDRTFGASGDDNGRQIVQTPDGGFWILADFESGTNGNRSITNAGGWWLIRLDGDGQKIAERGYNSPGGQASRFAALSGGGHLLAGTSLSGIGVVRVDANGNELWSRSHARPSAFDFALNVWETNGTIVIGATSYHSYTNSDFWIIGLNQQGDLLWQNVVPAGDMPFGSWCIAPATGGGLVLGGTDFALFRPDPDEEPQYFETEKNFRFVRVASGGQRIWQFSLGGPEEDDNLKMVLPTRDGGWLLAGESDAGVGGLKTVPNYGRTDFWVVKLAPDALNAPATLQAVPQHSTVLATNGYRFILWGVANADYVIERSINFSVWSPIRTNHLSSNSISILDNTATNLSRAFYRALPR
jgi:hypothetical protein